eukprot:42803-Karenia_brevis.AAC.1
MFLRWNCRQQNYKPTSSRYPAPQTTNKICHLRAASTQICTVQANKLLRNGTSIKQQNCNLWAAAAHIDKTN